MTADMLDLFQPPPKLTGDALLNSLLTETMADAGSLLGEEYAPEQGVAAQPGELYTQDDLLSDNIADSSGWLVDVAEFERGMEAPTLPDASEFAREKLATRPGMEWLSQVDAVLVAPHSSDPKEQLAQLRAFVEQLDSEAHLIPDTFFPRKAVHPYTPRKAIGADTETTGLDLRTRYGYDGHLLTNTKLVGLTFAPHPYKGYYLPVRHTGTDGVMNWNPGAIAVILSEMAQRFLMVWHNAAYDLEVLALNGVEVLEPFPYFFDTQIGSYIRDMNNPVHGLKPVSARMLGRKMIEIAELFVGFGGLKKTAYIQFNHLQATQALVYGASDSMNTIGIFHALLSEAAEINIFLTQALQISLDHDTINTVRNMLRTGMPVNYQYMLYALHDAVYRQILLQQEMDRVAGRAINAGSQPQLLDLLFNQFKLEPLPGMKRGANGNFSLDEKTLAKLHAAYPEIEILDLVVRHRKISANIVKIYSKLVTNSWVDAFLPFTRAKINFSQTGASTGRFTSSGNSGKPRVTVRQGKTKKRTRLYSMQSGAYEAGVNAQGLPAKIPFRTANARRVTSLPDAAGISLSRPYPDYVVAAVLRACAEL